MIQVGQLGCGYWGPNLLRAFASAPDCRVRWLADMRAERRQFVAESFPDTQTVDDWRRVVDDPAVDAVIVATPPVSHFELARAALHADKHVFVEKPLALSTPEADALVALAASKKRVLMVGHTFLYNPAVRYVKTALDEGVLGSLVYVHAERLNFGQLRSDVNAWWNLAPHDVSILLYWLGGRLPEAVDARGVAHLQKGIEDVVWASLRWSDGLRADIHLSWMHPTKVRRMTLVGTDRALIYDDVGSHRIAIHARGARAVPRPGEIMHYDGVGVLRGAESQVTYPFTDTREPLKLEAEHFLECVKTGATPLSGPRHARDVVSVLEKGEASLRAHTSIG
jgi:predicted dehydrogenase